MRRSVLVRNAPSARVSIVTPQFAARGRRGVLALVSLLVCLASSAMLTSCIQSKSSGSSNPLVVLVNNGSSQSAVVGMSFSAPLVAQVSHGENNPAGGVSVTFTAPSSGASGIFANGQLTETDTSDANGLVTSSTLTANSASGEFQVTATASGAALSASFGLANIPTSELNLSVNNGSQQSANVGAAFPTPLIVRVANNGTAVPGVAVTFTAPASGASGTFANGKTTESDVTDSNGLATSSKFTANNVGGQYEVTASISGGSTPANLILSNISAAQLNLSVSDGSEQSANVGAPFLTPLQVRVANNGAGVQGITVTFTAPSSAASGTFANGTSTESDVTDPDGVATSSTFTANGIPGQYQVMASISGGASGALYLSNLDPGFHVISGTPQTATVGSSFALPLQVSVEDPKGNPLAGVSVMFSAPSTGATATFVGGVFSETDVTDSNGFATSSTVTANSIAGNFSVTATVSGFAPVTFNLTNQTAAAAVVPTKGTPQRTAISSNFSTNLIARVLDAHGNPLSGVSVTFAAPTSGATGTFPNGATVKTDSNGNATAPFMANSTVGAYNVTANVGKLAPAKFALMNTPAGVTAYTFYLSGQEAINFQSHLNFYAVAGAILVDPNGNVTGGEEDYNDADGFTFTNIGITGGSLSFANGDPAGQGTLTLVTNNSQIGVSGTETFKVQFVNTNHALIVQFDDSATASGSMDVQILGNPSGGYAFTLTGVDPSYAPVGFGGVFATSGTRSTTQWKGTIDVADGNPLLGVVRGVPFKAGLGSMDAYGRGIMAPISIPISGLPPLNINIAYYQVGPKAMRLIDIDPTVAAAGSAFAQGTNAFAASNAGLGQSVFAVAGNTNVMNSTFFVTLGQFSTSNTSSQIANLTGVADEDELAQKIKNASPISGTYQVQSNGYGNLAITSANLGKVTSLALYLTDPTLNLSDPNNSANGGGGALLLELDTALTGGIGIITPQTDTSTNSFAGNYAGGWQDVNQLDGVPFPREFDTVSQGSMVANGNMSLIGVVSDPFETLTSAGTLSTGDTFTTIPQVDTAHLGSGRYTMLEANKPENPLDCILNFGTGVFTNFETVMYQVSGTQLFWYQRAIEPLRPAQLFLGPLEQQGSLDGIPAARKSAGRLKPTKADASGNKSSAE